MGADSHQWRYCTHVIRLCKGVFFFDGLSNPCGMVRVTKFPRASASEKTEQISYVPSLDFWRCLSWWNSGLNVDGSGSFCSESLYFPNEGPSSESIIPQKFKWIFSKKKKYTESFLVLIISILYKSKWWWHGKFSTIYIGQFYNHESFLTFPYYHLFPISL